MEVIKLNTQYSWQNHNKTKPARRPEDVPESIRDYAIDELYIGGIFSYCY